MLGVFHFLFHWGVRKQFIIKQYLVLHCSLMFSAELNSLRFKAEPFAHVIPVFEVKKSNVIFDLI